MIRSFLPKLSGSCLLGGSPGDTTRYRHPCAPSILQQELAKTIAGSASGLSVSPIQSSTLPALKTSVLSECSQGTHLSTATPNPRPSRPVSTNPTTCLQQTYALVENEDSESETAMERFDPENPERTACLDYGSRDGVTVVDGNGSVGVRFKEGGLGEVGVGGTEPWRLIHWSDLRSDISPGVGGGGRMKFPRGPDR